MKYTLHIKHTGPVSVEAETYDDARRNVLNSLLAPESDIQYVSTDETPGIKYLPITPEWGRSFQFLELYSFRNNCTAYGLRKPINGPESWVIIRTDREWRPVFVLEAFNRPADMQRNFDKYRKARP